MSSLNCFNQQEKSSDKKKNFLLYFLKKRKVHINRPFEVCLLPVLPLILNTN
jgi:hypothetical protein